MKIRSYEKKFDSFFHVILRNLVLIVVIWSKSEDWRRQEIKS
jgi:hypothetical protein